MPSPELTTQTKRSPTASAVGKRPVRTGAPTRRRETGSTRVTVPRAPLVTHTASGPTATSTASPCRSIVPARLESSARTRVSESVAAPVAQTDRLSEARRSGGALSGAESATVGVSAS